MTPIPSFVLRLLQYRAALMGPLSAVFCRLLLVSHAASIHGHHQSSTYTDRTATLHRFHADRMLTRVHAQAKYHIE